MYKKFIINFSSVIIMVIIVIMVTNYLYINTNYYKTSFSNSVNKFDNVPYNIQLANFGNSHGFYGLDYKNINSINTFNFALGSQTPRYDYIILKKYVDHFQKNSVVIFPISYFSLYEKYPGEDPNFKIINKQYYYFLENDLIDNYEFSEKLLSYIPALSAKLSLKYIIFDTSSNDVYNRIKFADKEQLIILGRDRANKHLKSIDYDSKIKTEEFKPTPIMYDSYIKIIDLCKAKNITPIFITTPYLEEYSNNFSEEYLKQFYKDVNTLCKYGGVNYFDYSRDERFKENYIFFMDSDHLNNYGAQEFTDIVVNDLKKSGILPESININDITQK